MDQCGELGGRKGWVDLMHVSTPLGGGESVLGFHFDEGVVVLNEC